jgi:hypothetical protein
MESDIPCTKAVKPLLSGIFKGLAKVCSLQESLAHE